MSPRRTDIHLQTVRRHLPIRHLPSRLNNATRVRSDPAVSKSSWNSWSRWNTWSGNERERDGQPIPKRICFNTIRSDSWVNIYLRNYWKRFRVLSSCYSVCIHIHSLYANRIKFKYECRITLRWNNFFQQLDAHLLFFPSSLDDASGREKERKNKEQREHQLYIRAKKGSLKLSQSPCDGATWRHIRVSSRWAQNCINGKRIKKRFIYSMFLFFVYQQPKDFLLFLFSCE